MDDHDSIVKAALHIARKRFADGGMADQQMSRWQQLQGTADAALSGGQAQEQPSPMPAPEMMQQPEPQSPMPMPQPSVGGYNHGGYISMHHMLHRADGGVVDKALQAVGEQQSNPVATASQVVSGKRSEPLFFAGSPEYTQNLKNWFKDSHEDLADENGMPKKIYIGTTGDFNKFDRRKMNIEGDHGAGFYSSDSIRDVNANYAGEGPDLKNRIDRYVEQNFQDEFEDPDTGEEYTPEQMREMAKDALGVKHMGAVMPVHISMKNPVVLGGKNESFFDFEHPYDEKNDEYGEPKGKLLNVLNGIRKAAAEFDLSDHDVDDMISKIHERAIDRGGIYATDLESIVKKGAAYAYDPDTGDSATNELWRLALEHAGHDGIIDHTVDNKFGSNRRGFAGARIPGMEGVTSDTTHYIAFRPEQIKSAVGNRGTFDPKEADLRKSEGGEVEEEFARGGMTRFHPALNIPGVHIRTADAGEPVFHGEE